MKINCLFFATLRLALGCPEYVVHSDKDYLTVMEILRILDEQFNNEIIHKLLEEENTIKVGTIILVNGKNILHGDKLLTKVYGDDKFVIFPPAGGG